MLDLDESIASFSGLLIIKTRAKRDCFSYYNKEQIQKANI